MLGAMDAVPIPGIGEVPIEGIPIPIPERSIIIVLVIILTS